MDGVLHQLLLTLDKAAKDNSESDFGTAPTAAVLASNPLQLCQPLPDCTALSSDELGVSGLCCYITGNEICRPLAASGRRKLRAVSDETSYPLTLDDVDEAANVIKKDRQVARIRLE